MKLRNLEGSEAADEIERLRAERDEAQAEANAGRQAEHDADVERRAVESERDRLREALQHVILWVEQYANPQAILPYNTDPARAVLKETGHAQTNGIPAFAPLNATLRALLAERDRLRSGLLRAIQYENKCDETGKSCDESRACPCACSLEAETWCRT